MAFWILKSEPGSYGWNDLIRDERTEWNGVRNNAAAAHLRASKAGDRALFYHSGKDKAAVGIVDIVRGPQPDGSEGNWVSVAVAPVAPLAAPVTLAAMKADPRLEGMAMLRQPRLSVAPLTEGAWAVLMELAGEAA